MRRRSLCALAFFLCLFGLLSSGRIASLDAAQQLRVAVMLAHTGEIGASGAPGSPPSLGWVRAPNGRLYQAHDIGNVFLMLPAALVGGSLSPLDATAEIANPPVITRAAVSLTCAVTAALGCWWFFRLCELHVTRRQAFLLALAFPLTTLLLAYARAAWDVLGACVFVAGAMYCSGRMLAGVHPDRHAMLSAAALALAMSFRFSLAPFVAAAMPCVFVLARPVLRPRTWVTSAIVFVVLLLPTFAYNHLRTGSPFRPATAFAQYRNTTAALNGDLTDGLYGLLISPNRGLFVFCPVLLLGLALPWVWRRTTTGARALISSYGIGLVAYVLLIARLQQWHATFGWGPRYLVPVLPVFAFTAAIVAVQLWARWRAAILSLALASFLLTVPSGVVNWHLATTHFRGAADPYAVRPIQLEAAWRTLLLGLGGTDLPVPADATGDPVRATTAKFPDLLLVRVFRYSPSARLPAAGAGALLVLAGVFCARRMLTRDERPARDGAAATLTTR